MEKEKITEFTRRISQCNRSGLTLITYEICFVHCADAKKAYAQKEHEVFKKEVQKASECVNRLMETLNFEYEIAKELYPVYRFCRDELAMALVKNDISRVENAEKILKNLYGAFEEISKEDYSRPLMENSEKVIAGMTYQKNNLTENYEIGNESRGFLA